MCQSGKHTKRHNDIYTHTFTLSLSLSHTHTHTHTYIYIYIYIYIYKCVCVCVCARVCVCNGKIGNKSDSIRMYKDEKNIKSSKDDFIRRNIC